jgi:hypothetical protein
LGPFRVVAAVSNCYLPASRNKANPVLFALIWHCVQLPQSICIALVQPQEAKSLTDWTSQSQKDIKNSEVPPHELGCHDLLVCSPTVFGFSLNDKQWRKSPRIS